MRAATSSACPTRGLIMQSPPAQPPQARTVEISEAQLRRLQVAALSIAHALRSLNAPAASEEVGRLIGVVSEVIGAPPEALLRRLEDHPELLSIRAAQHAGVAYPKLWDRMWRTWADALSAFEQGGASDAILPLAFMAEGLAALPRLRDAWAREGGFAESLSGRVEGTAAEHRQDPWIHQGVDLLAQRPLSAATLQSLADRAEPRVARALDAISQGAYGEAEGHLRRALRLDPAHGEARLMLGEVLRRTDRADEARLESCHLLEEEAVRARLSTGPAGRLRSQVRVARARLCLARCNLLEAQLHRALGDLRLGMEHLEWSLRHASPDILTEADRAHLQDEAHRAWVLLDRLSQQLGEERPVRLRP